MTKSTRNNYNIFGLIIIIITWVLTSARCEHFKMWKVNHLTMLLSFDLNSCVWLSLLGKTQFINCYVLFNSLFFAQMKTTTKIRNQPKIQTWSLNEWKQACVWFLVQVKAQGWGLMLKMMFCNFRRTRLSKIFLINNQDSSIQSQCQL